MNIRSSKHPKPDVVVEASAWFIEFRSGDVTVNDRARFYDWLRRSPEHIEAYLEIAEGWAELPTSDPEGRLDIPGLIERARESQDESVVPLSPGLATPPPRRRVAVRAWAASFAGLALIAGFGMWVALTQTNTYSTGVGEQRTVRLVEGSTIELNALSTIRVRLSKNTREIDLDAGQALFHVAKDPARPFLVRSDGTTVRAVGTQFDVYKKRDGTVVTVLEGRVAVSSPSSPLPGREEGQYSSPDFQPPSPTIGEGRDPRSGRGEVSAVFLTAGEQVTVPTKDSVRAAPKPKRADVAVATAWVQKRLIFEDTPLANVAEEFNRYNTRRLVIDDPNLRSKGISGVYSSTDPDSLLGFLRAQPNIQVTETQREIRIVVREKK